MIKYSIAVLSSKPGTKKADIKETKAYGVTQIDEIMEMDDFCQHIAEHNSPFSKGAVQGILIDAVQCLREQMLAGNKVKLGALGDFHAEISTKGAKVTEDFSASNIQAVNIRWTPGKSFRNLRQDAAFQLVPSRKAVREDIQVIRNEETIQGLE